MTLKSGAGPCASSIYRPCIALPDNSARWSDATLRAVLAHELVHVTRRDDRALLLLRTTADCLWWLPWLRLLVHHFERTLEESCDDRAAELVGQSHTYLEGVCAAVRPVGRVPRRLSHPAPARNNPLPHHGPHGLVGRVARFLQGRELETDTGRVYWIVTLSVLVVALATSVEVVTPEPSLRVTRSLGFVQPVPYPRVAVSHRPAERLRRDTLQVTPVYPAAALQERVEGVVIASYWLASDGSIAQPRVLFAQPPGVFDRSVLSALRNSSFEMNWVREVPELQPRAFGHLGVSQYRFSLGDERGSELAHHRFTEEENAL